MIMQTILIADLILSEKGRDWNGNKLNEDTPLANNPVYCKGELYTAGNRRHNLLELYNYGVLIKVEDFKNIQLIKWPIQP